MPSNGEVMSLSFSAGPFTVERRWWIGMARSAATPHGIREQGNFCGTGHVERAPVPLGRAALDFGDGRWRIIDPVIDAITAEQALASTKSWVLQWKIVTTVRPAVLYRRGGVERQ